MKALAMPSLALVAVLLTACRAEPTLETRTFRLQHLAPGDAGALVDPYVYGDREGAPGTMSYSDAGLTVRETPDNLDKIARVLEEFDRARPDVHLRFQLIEADGFTEHDARIEAVETELRKIFQFGGYRLVGEAFVSATDGSRVEQILRAKGDLYEITGEVYWETPSTIRLVNVRFHGNASGLGLTTTVNIRPGQTLVLGSSPAPGARSTLLLTVRAEQGTQ